MTEVVLARNLGVPTTRGRVKSNVDPDRSDEVRDIV